MTTACRQVMVECDFGEADARGVELLLLEHSPQQVIRLVWSKDPEGEHGLEWFKPFFDRGYVSRTVDVRLPGPPDEDFWSAYEWWGQADPELSTFHLPDVWTMSRDPRRMKAAYAQAKVKKVPYVAKVFGSVEARRTPEGTKVEFEVGNSGGVRTGEL